MNYNFIRSSSNPSGATQRIIRPKDYPADIQNITELVNKAIVEVESASKDRKVRQSSENKSLIQRMQRYNSNE